MPYACTWAYPARRAIWLTSAIRALPTPFPRSWACTVRTSRSGVAHDVGECADHSAVPLRHKHGVVERVLEGAKPCQTERVPRPQELFQLRSLVRLGRANSHARKGGRRARANERDCGACGPNSGTASCSVARLPLTPTDASVWRSPKSSLMALTPRPDRERGRH